MLPAFSVVIPSRRRPDLLRACLTGVTRFAPAATEIVVVDDASRREAVSAVAGDFEGVRCLRLAEQRGFCAAANAGIRTAQGTIVEILNDDTEVSIGWAEPALALFDDPRVGAVAPLVLCHPGKHSTASAPVIDSAGDRYYVGGVAGKRGHGQRADHAQLRRRRVFGASASSAFYRRDAVLRVGSFPESFQAYFEDVDLAFRLHWAGYEIWFEPASQVLHHVSASYGRPHGQLLEQQSRNEERVFWRNLPARVLFLAFPYHLAVLLAKARRRWSEGNLAPFVRGRLRAFSEIGTILRHRRWLRQLRSSSPLNQWELDWRY